MFYQQDMSAVFRRISSRFDKLAVRIYGISGVSLPRLSGYDEMSTEPR